MNLKLSFVHVCLCCFLLPAENAVANTFNAAHVGEVMGLICYQCRTTVSWERCRTTTKTCHPNNDRCAKVHFKVGKVDNFLKDCIPKAECVKGANYFCKGAVECDVNCCDGNDCNAGPLLFISGILFFTCAVISVVSHL